MSADRVLPLAEVRADFSKIVTDVERTHERVTVTRNGRPVAVIMSPEDLESLEETLSILSDPDALRQIREAQAEVARGEFVRGDELFEEYRARRVSDPR